MALLVYNIEPASPSMISSLDRHCLQRVPDGASNIVPARSHLNRTLEGDERGVMQSLRNFYDRGIQRPAAQAEKPYLRIVLSASPEYFRPDDPAAVGTWDEDRLTAWIDASMKQLRAEHGDDLIFAELHLDEDTPHFHAVVAPTYGKKARKPGKQKRNETLEQFEARKAAALASEGVRTVGRASHPTLSKPGSFQRLRERMTVALDHLGIEYGEDRAIDAPDGKSTREWVIEQAAQLREEKRRIAQEREQLSKDRAELDRTEAYLISAAHNLSLVIGLANDGTHDDEIPAGVMADQPQKLAVLKAAAPDGRPTRGFHGRFWSLNNNQTGEPLSMPNKIRDSLTNSFDRVAAWAVEVRKGKLEAQAAAREAAEARKEAQALRDALEPLRAAVAAVEAWEAEKARAAWWDMTPEARLAAKLEKMKAARRAGASDDELKAAEAEVFQLRAEAGTIIRVETLDPEMGQITGEDLRTGAQVTARIILDENERVKHYPSTNVTGPEAQKRMAQRLLGTIRNQIASAVAGSIVFLAGLKMDGSDRIVAGVPACQPPRLDPRSAPPPVEAEPLLDLPPDAQTKVRQALGTRSVENPGPL